SATGTTLLTPQYSWENALNIEGNTRIYQPNSGYGYALSVTGDSYMEGNLDVSGILSANQLDVTHITFSGLPLDVSRDVTINGNLSATGTTLLTPQYSWENALNIDGNTKIYQPNSGYGYALSVTGSSYMHGSLEVSG
ncbi:hypothetical protein MHK_002134, partial [Candidatus Magnetomorum sp. HK-1]